MLSPLLAWQRGPQGVLHDAVAGHWLAISSGEVFEVSAPCAAIGLPKKVVSPRKTSSWGRLGGGFMFVVGFGPLHPPNLERSSQRATAKYAPIPQWP